MTKYKLNLVKYKKKVVRKIWESFGQKEFERGKIYVPSLNWEIYIPLDPGDEGGAVGLHRRRRRFGQTRYRDKGYLAVNSTDIFWKILYNIHPYIRYFKSFSFQPILINFLVYIIIFFKNISKVRRSWVFNARPTE